MCSLLPYGTGICHLAFICRGAGWGVREAGWKHE